MQEAAIEYVRRVSEHCFYDALERQGVIVAELLQQRQSKKSDDFLSGAVHVPSP